MKMIFNPLHRVEMNTRQALRTRNDGCYFLLIWKQVLCFYLPALFVISEASAWIEATGVANCSSVDLAMVSFGCIT